MVLGEKAAIFDWERAEKSPSSLDSYEPVQPPFKLRNSN